MSTFRPSVNNVHVSRMLERALKESRAIDTEGLCIKAEEMVSYLPFLF